MFGYIMPNEKELKVREYDVYKAYYCGLCKVLGKRYSVLMKNALSNDCTFLALLLSSLEQTRDEAVFSHCVFHPTRKLMVIKDDAYLSYAADINVLLTYYKLKDNSEDEGDLPSKIGSAALKGYFEKAKANSPKACQYIEQSLFKLKKLEEEKCEDIDLVSDAFASMMEGIAVSAPGTYGNELQLKWLFYNMGKYIYILDALDDMVKDEEKNSYNVFLLKHKNMKAKDIGLEIREQVQYNLAMSLNEASKAFELLPVYKNQGILRNIIYDGTVGIMDTIIKRRCIDGSI